MPRLSRPLLAIALLTFAPFARAESLRVVAPANGITLRGGSFAELRWSADQLPRGAEEWEAFLSIDGGKYYAFRVTPHLDIALHRFTFVVPNVDTRNARILIRTGDEVRETHFESGDSFAIVRDANAEETGPRLLQSGRGEAARDGDPAVLAWADGARNGSGITQRTSAPISSRSFDARATETSDAFAVTAPAVKSVLATISTETTQRPVPDTHARNAAPLPIAADLLLVCRRRNI
jgi:hypothetical protein